MCTVTAHAACKTVDRCCLTIYRRKPVTSASMVLGCASKPHTCLAVPVGEAKALHFVLVCVRGCDDHMLCHTGVSNALAGLP